MKFDILAVLDIRRMLLSFDGLDQFDRIGNHILWMGGRFFFHRPNKSSLQ